MRLRNRNIDYLKKASQAAIQIYKPLYLPTFQQTDENDVLCSSNFSIDELFGASDTFDVCSNVENLSFTNVHRQLISGIFPHKQRTAELKKNEESREIPDIDEDQDLSKACREAEQENFFSGENTDIFFKKSSISAAWFELEAPELVFSQGQTVQSDQMMLELGFMPSISIEVDSSLCLLQDLFARKQDNVINLYLCSFLSGPRSSDEDRILEVCQDYANIVCIEKKENMMDSVLVGSSTEQDGSSKFSEHVGSLFHFEVSEVGLDKYDNQEFREPLFLLDSKDLFGQFEQQPKNLVDTAELPCSMNFTCYDFFRAEHPSGYIYDKVDSRFSPIYTGTFLEMEFCVAPLMDMGENSGTIKWESATATQTQVIEVPDILDSGYIQTFKMSSELMEAIEVTMEESDESNLRSQGYFDELVVVPELTLTDNSFKSLPTPVFYDDKEDLVALSVTKMLLHQLKEHSTSASDWLYLDWHQSQGGACNNRSCFPLQKKIRDEENCRLINFTVPSLKLTSNVFNTMEYFDKHQDNQPEINGLELSESVCISDIPRVKSGSVPDGLPDSFDMKIQKNLQNTLQSSSEKVSLLFNSMSVSSDLSFYLNAKRSSVRCGDPSAKETNDRQNSLHPDLNEFSNTISSHVDCQKNRIQLHHIEMSKPVVDIIDCIRTNYEMVLDLDNELKRIVDTFPNLKTLRILHSDQVDLMSLIKNRASQIGSLKYDTVLRGLGTMHVLQKTAFDVCFYGVQVAYLYLTELVQSIEFLEDSIKLPYSLLKDAYHRFENGLTEEHPMLSSLERILTLDFFPRSDHKVLLVSERKAFLPLRNKISLMNLKLHELDGKEALCNQILLEGEKLDKFNRAVLDALSHGDCLIVSHKHVTSSFPFEHFKTILEYGDSHLSSQFSSIAKNISHKCHIHLLRVELKGNVALPLVPVLPEASTSLADLKSEEETTCWLISVLQERDQNHDRIEQQLTLPPTMSKAASQTSLTTALTTEGKVPKCNMLIDVMGSRALSPIRSVQGESGYGDRNGPHMTKSPCMIIIANVREFDEEMIASRRSSYQKILALEKKGLQVVEREFHLPVDLIFSASICLVWFTVEKLRRYSSVLEENALPTCVENVADSLLMSLSFSFRDCILIFEGNDSFLREVMEASDDLYAASIGLGIRLQCCLSGSPETTDQIILNCIHRAIKSTEVVYSHMLESETLAEAFLIKFSSINPLSAHAILSSGDTLSEFLCRTREHQIRLMRKFDVPEKGISLFSSQSSYGELGETKSGTTDCSSTLTSPFDGDSNRTRKELDLKKLDVTLNLHSKDIPVKECLDADSSETSCFGKRRKVPSESFNRLQPSQISQINYTQSPLFERDDNHYRHTDDEHLAGLHWDCTLDKDTVYSNSDLIDELGPSSVSRKLHGDVYEETVNMCKDFQNGAFDRSQYDISRMDFTRSRCDIENPPSVSLQMRTASIATIANRINQVEDFQNNLRCFPSPAKINCELDQWDSSNKSKLYGLKGGEIRKQSQMENAMMDMSSSPEMDCWHGEVSNWRQKSIRNALERSGLARGQRLFNNSKNAFRGKGPNLAYPRHRLRGSAEFLYPPVRKEYSSANGRNSASENILDVSSFCQGPSPAHKTVSPYTFDNYSYHSVSESRIECKKKWQKILRYPKQSPTTNKGPTNSASSSLQSSTPLDKRAKQTLTFVKGGTNKQSRLVWSDINAENVKRRRIDKKSGI